MHTDIRSLAPNQKVDDVYLLRECQLRTTKTGKYYLHVELGDKTGQIGARMWNATEALFKALDKAEFVRVAGRAEVYQDSLQLIINTVRAVNADEVTIEDFLPATTQDVDEMYAKLRELADSVGNAHLSQLLDSFLEDEDFSARFKKAPAAVSYHQPFLGGLLEHTLAVTEMADYVAERYPLLDRDLLITGTILHDIGKIEELSYVRAFDYTDRGRLIGHLIIAVEMIQDRVRQIEGFPQHLFDLGELDRIQPDVPAEVLPRPGERSGGRDTGGLIVALLLVGRRQRHQDGIVYLVHHFEVVGLGPEEVFEARVAGGEFLKTRELTFVRHLNGFHLLFELANSLELLLKIVLDLLGLGVGQHLVLGLPQQTVALVPADFLPQFFGQFQYLFHSSLHFRVATPQPEIL